MAIWKQTANKLSSQGINVFQTYRGRKPGILFLVSEAEAKSGWSELRCLFDVSSTSSSLSMCREEREACIVWKALQPKIHLTLLGKVQLQYEYLLQNLFFIFFSKRSEANCELATVWIFYFKRCHRVSSQQTLGQIFTHKSCTPHGITRKVYN